MSLSEILPLYPDRFARYAKGIRTEIQAFMTMVADSFLGSAISWKGIQQGIHGK